MLPNISGLSYDLYDGRQPEDKLSAENKKSALIANPGLLEFFGYAFFPGSCLIGPQFPLRRYQDFVCGHFSEEVCYHKVHIFNF